MEGLAPAAPPQAADRLRWLDLLPVIAFTVLGIILVFAVLVGLARGNRGFYRANLGTISLSAALAVYLAFGSGIVVALRRLRADARPPLHPYHRTAGGACRKPAFRCGRRIGPAACSAL